MIVSPADLDTMVRTLSGEARGESDLGQIAVAWVIRNRAESPAWWGKTIGEVCRKPWQFSCWLEKDRNAANLAHIKALKETDTEYRKLKRVCELVLNGEPDPTKGCDHYKVRGTPASWDDAVKNIPPIRIGSHLFFKLGPGP